MAFPALILGHRTGDPVPAPLPRRSEADVMRRWQGDRPVVSVRCATYQHVGFIEDALRGFLGQDTDFPFEVLIRDDASTDGTAEIVRDYAERFPTIIRAVLETENRYPEVRAGSVLGPMVRGQFIASCEGDDYWTDPRKLQIQHDGLVEHRQFVVSHHGVLVAADGLVVRPEKRSPRQCRDFSAGELARGARIITSSVMRRNVPLLEPRGKPINVDMWSRARLGLHGGARWEPSLSPSVHRIHAGGIWSTKTEAERARIQSDYFARFAEEFAAMEHQELARYYRRMAFGLDLYARVAGSSRTIARMLGRIRTFSWGA
jgi:glycosyltransferase involved in cell wall biosynthesis